MPRGRRRTCCVDGSQIKRSTARVPISPPRNVTYRYPRRASSPRVLSPCPSSRRFTAVPASNPIDKAADVGVTSRDVNLARGKPESKQIPFHDLRGLNKRARGGWRRRLRSIEQTSPNDHRAPLHRRVPIRHSRADLKSTDGRRVNSGEPNVVEINRDRASDGIDKYAIRVARVQRSRRKRRTCSSRS